MKKSMDLMNEKRYKKIILSNDLEDLEDNQNHDNNALTHIYTMENIANKKNLSSDNNDINPSTLINNKNSNEIFPEKNDFMSERKTYNKNIKNNWIKLGKNNKDNKKRVYIKKKKLEKANKNENKIDNENKIVVQSPNKEDKDNDFEQKEIIKEIKDSVMCYICLMKITSPRICPNCHKIACEKCLRNWFIEKGNNNCGYCRAILSFDKMISIPIINDVANLIDKISSKNATKKLGTKYTKSKNVKKNYKSISDISNELNNNNTEIVNNDN